MFKFTRKIEPTYGLGMRINSLRDLLFNCYFCKLDKETYTEVLNAAIKALNDLGVSVSTEQVATDSIEVVFSVQYDSTNDVLKKITVKTLDNYASNLYSPARVTEEVIKNNFEINPTLKTVVYDEEELYKKLNSFFNKCGLNFNIAKLNTILNTFVDDSCTLCVE